MIKKLTISAPTLRSGPRHVVVGVALLTMFVLTSNSANAGYFSDNSHIDDNFGYLKSLAQNTDTHEDTSKDKPEPTPVPAQVSKTKVIKTTLITTYVVMASAYSSTPDQTDDTPFITAWGTQVRDGIIAANFLPFGTLVKMPELYGDKIFIVEDRMNRRYTYKIDVWFPERNQAMEFGNKKVKIEIVAKL